MVSIKVHFQVVLFILSSSYITPSWSSDSRDAGYNKWISWNVQNYQKKTVMETKWNVAPFDLRQSKAEINKVTVTVSQNGTADFKTITDALSSIPPRNTRRVILSIAPGVYRYIQYSINPKLCNSLT